MSDSTLPRLGFAAIVSILVGLIPVGAAAQEAEELEDASGFVVRTDKGVAPVREAPLTLRIQRIGADGRPDRRFDWAGSALEFEGLETVDGNPLTRVELTPPGATGARVTSMYVDESLQIDDGVAVSAHELVIDNVVVTGAVLIKTGSRTIQPLERTVPGWAAIIAPLVAILIAVITRQVLVALFTGIWVGCVAIWGGLWGGFTGLLTDVLPASLDSSRIQILFFSCALGGVVALIARMGGTQGLVNAVSRFGDSRRGTQFTTWLAGLAIFFDDYANALLVGNTMRPITDRYRISREKLSYLVDTTAAPVACIMVISTWIATEIGYIAGRLSDAGIQAATGLNETAAYDVFLGTIPYNFYPILALIFGLAICLTQRDFGPMRRAEERALREGKVLADGATPLTSTEMDELAPADPDRLRWYNAAIPILTVVTAVLAGLYASGSANLAAQREAARNEALAIRYELATGTIDAERRAALTAELEKQDGIAAAPASLHDVFGNSDSYSALMIAAFLGALVAMALALSQRLLSLSQTMETFIAGVKSMIPAVCVLILAWTLQTVCERLETSQWLIHHTEFSLEFMPLVVFALSATIAFATGTSWGTMGILVPLTIDYVVGLATGTGPITAAAQLETAQVMTASVGAVLAGAVFGDHCSPISDTTIMSSMACGADHVDHVKTQLPYAVVVAILAILTGYLPAGFGVSPWLLLPVGAVACVVAVRLLGRPITAE